MHFPGHGYHQRPPCSFWGRLGQLWAHPSRIAVGNQKLEASRSCSSPGVSAVRLLEGCAGPSAKNPEQLPALFCQVNKSAFIVFRRRTFPHFFIT